jgi:hypothetical protein
MTDLARNVEKHANRLNAMTDRKSHFLWAPVASCCMGRSDGFAIRNGQYRSILRRYFPCGGMTAVVSLH